VDAATGSAEWRLERHLRTGPRQAVDDFFSFRCTDTCDPFS
jgi:hypothetical protein